VSSQYLISTRWMSHRVLLRSLGRCCLGLVALLVAGGAAGMRPVSLNCPLPRTPKNPPPYINWSHLIRMIFVAEITIKLVVGLSQQTGSSCWEVLNKNCEQKGELLPQLTSLTILAEIRSMHPRAKHVCLHQDTGHIARTSTFPYWSLGQFKGGL